jgi:ERCC4-type nuclease
MPSKTRAAGPAPYTVLRDTREQAGWTFPKSDRCAGTHEATLKTGDYTLAGWEGRLAVERKGSPAELAANLFQPRFERELARLDAFEHPYLFLEFTADDVVRFPFNSGIPPARWRSLRVTPQLFLKRLHEAQLDHPTLRVWFVGGRGREVASSLFKRLTERGP